jgi:hypothetical protein
VTKPIYEPDPEGSRTLPAQSLQLQLAAAHLLTLAEIEGLILGGTEVQLVNADGATLIVRPWDAVS